MKKYKKYTGKLLQIRLTDEEYEDTLEFIKRFKVTRRDWLLAAKEELKDFTIIRNGKLYYSHQDYAYQNKTKWDKSIIEDSKCEICGSGFYDYHANNGENYNKTLVRHHHDGYEGKNAYKTHIVCRRCHGICHRKENINKKFESIKIN